MNEKRQRGRAKGVALELNRNAILYFMAVPGIVLLFLFNYLPMAGVLIAFKNFDFADGIFGSEWAKPIFNNFNFLFTSETTFRATRNTILLNLTFIVCSTVVAVGLALLLNEVRHKLFKKSVQSFTLLPFFVSWIVVSVFAYSIFAFDQGILNQLLGWFGLEKVNWYNTPKAWPIILTLITIWKSAGYNSILYIATLSGVDTSYYEAAEIDGASRFKKMRYISLPMLKPTIIILSLLAIGRIMNADFGMFYGIIGDNPNLYATTDVLDTFIFRNLRVIGDVGMASAASFYQSFIAFFLVLACNRWANKYQNGSGLF
ncbi:ABC transporter permease [Cohnella sp. JJ-181]|uniref:ABC transporter permease n=1 Tax=Cohnella rhizoplanae TaxID=2974897 RepID=UPI0022FF793C|nr:ABC transporter permease subunit [Cohnella sp. JJ-181]CAI6083162.1 putative multiple-sugar transport system permease YteP [Cohnella sp. JJ-181]